MSHQAMQLICSSIKDGFRPRRIICGKNTHSRYGGNLAYEIVKNAATSNRCTVFSDPDNEGRIYLRYPVASCRHSQDPTNPEADARKKSRMSWSEQMDCTGDKTAKGDKKDGYVTQYQQKRKISGTISEIPEKTAKGDKGDNSVNKFPFRMQWLRRKTEVKTLSVTPR